ncbi:hypothetical protein [Streptomyces sp. NBC_01216]|uniref:hypothetical protein n=1 Tax=unclassified Streptomyces TaxID=2593676 RepID=UPI002E15B599|nr:hypothetical protein OG393_10610 [Streptomyces sp. NBC_01216]
MISEPELTGGAGFPGAGPPTTLLDLGPPGPPERPAPGRPWLWALGGAVVASAVWAAGLYAYQRHEAGRGPDLGGYHRVEDLCAKVRLKALAAELGPLAVDHTGSGRENPALDRYTCSGTLGSPDTGYGVNVSFDLHRVTDPGPEFAALFGDPDFEAEPVQGLGEQAFFQLEEEQSGAWMRVLDGYAEAEISLQLRQVWDRETNEAVPRTRKVDLSGVDALLAQDLRTLMAELKKP